MSDDFEPGAIVRLNFFFRPDIDSDKDTGKPIIKGQEGNGKPRNGLVVMRNKNLLSVVPISHNILSTKPDRLYKLPRKLLRETEKLNDDQDSYLLCDQVNEIDAYHHNVFATARGRHGSARVYGISDYKTLTTAQRLFANVYLEDKLYHQQNGGSVDLTDKQQARIYKIERPLWKYIHPKNDQREKELLHPAVEASGQSSRKNISQRQAIIKSAVQRSASQNTVASKLDTKKNTAKGNKPNGRSRDWER
tara:strand:+ start:926 stop:1672 length:747 start_codon:yes stop_codon:yes gene_type:complete